MNHFTSIFWTKPLIRVNKNPLAGFVQHADHQSFHFYYIAAGCCHINLDNEDLLLPADTICLFAPDVLHVLMPDQNCVFYQMILSDDLLEYLIPLCPEPGMLLSFLLRSVLFDSKSSYLQLFPDRSISAQESLVPQQICEAMYRESAAPNLISNHLLFHLLQVLIHLTLRSYSTVLYMPETIQHAEDLCLIGQYLLQNYADGTLSALADKLNFSVSYCSRFVKEATGLSFKQLQKKIRMQKAVNCLLHTDMQINQISELIGYSSPENFMKLFHQEYGMSPSTYRQNRRQTDAAPSCQACHP